MFNTPNQPAVGSDWYQYWGRVWLGQLSLYGEEDGARVSEPTPSRVPAASSAPAQPCQQRALLLPPPPTSEVISGVSQPLRVGNPHCTGPWKCRPEPVRSIEVAASWQRGIWLLCRSLVLQSQFPRLLQRGKHQQSGFTPANLPAPSWPLGWNNATCSHASSFLHAGFGSWF